MAKCKQCGKFVLLSSSLKDDLCSNCYKIVMEKQNLANEIENELKEIQKTADIKKAEEYFNKLTSYKALSKVSIENANIESIKTAIKSCDKFIDLLENISEVPYISDVISPKITISKYSSKHYIDGIGAVVYDRANQLIRFDCVIEETKKEKEHLEKLLECSKSFENLLSSIKNVDISLSKPDSDYIYPLNEFPVIKTTNITARTSVSSLNHFVVIDVETTGLKPFENEIIQVSAIRFIGFEPVECFSTYIKPEKGLNEETKKINGITEKDVTNAPVFSEIIDSFCNFIGNKVPIIGHNIPFDINFLIDSGINPTAFLKRKIYDTLQLSKSQFSRIYSYKLDNLSRLRLNIIRNDSHTATSDSLICGLLFKEICKQRIKF